MEQSLALIPEQHAEVTARNSEAIVLTLQEGNAVHAALKELCVAAKRSAGAARPAKPGDTA